MTATYLVIKHSNGYLDTAGGAAAAGDDVEAVEKTVPS